MTDASTPKQASEPDQEIVSSDQAQVYAPPNPGGSAQLDANIAASGSTHPETVTDPIATNFSSGTGDAKMVGAESVAGSDASSGTSSDTGTQAAMEKGTVHLQNRSTVSDNEVQGTLPDTDPNSLPIDADVNLPD